MPSNDFPAFVEEQLSALPELLLRRMFGGHGLYAGEVFFGLIASDHRLYFRTSERTRGRYLTAGSQPFSPSARVTLHAYYEVPLEVLEDTRELTLWAREAIEESRAIAQPPRSRPRKNPRP